MIVDLPGLKSAVANYFNVEDLKTLLDDLTGNSETVLPTGGIGGFAREVIDHFHRRLMHYELREYLQKERPRVNWSSFFAKRVVIHTSILEGAFGDPQSPKPDCCTLTDRIATHDIVLCVDDGARIIIDYQTTLATSELFQKWFGMVVTNSKYEPKFCGVLDGVHAASLSACSPTDQVFIAVASGADKILVTEKAVMTTASVISYLTGSLGLAVHDATSACGVI